MQRSDDLNGEGMATLIPFPSHRVSIPTHQTGPSWPGQVIDYQALKARWGEAGSPPQAAPEGPESRDADTERAHRVALHQLSVTGRSEAEVRRALAGREIAPEVIDQEIVRLTSVGLLDDRALAHQLIERGQRLKKLGPLALREQLRRRQIPAEIIDEVLSGSSFDDNAVHQLATDRMASLRHLPADVARRRLSAFLQRRGYSSSEVARTVASVMAAFPADPEEQALQSESARP